jgi:TRAP-type C4-dicarboxylate transport system, small permease component
MPRLKAHVDRVLGAVVATLMGLAVVNVLWQVFTRFVLNDPSAFTDELARYLLIWVGLLGSSYATGQRLHLAIDLLPTLLTGRARQILQLVIDTSVLVFALGIMGGVVPISSDSRPPSGSLPPPSACRSGESTPCFPSAAPLWPSMQSIFSSNMAAVSEGVTLWGRPRTGLRPSRPLTRTRPTPLYPGKVLSAPVRSAFTQRNR